MLPKAYWGGVHDPLQLALAVGLNIAFYAVSFYVIRKFVGRRAGSS